MSEYQFYEFQTVDRRLTEEEQAEIRKLSSRVVPTATQAIFTYQFGDFRGDPLKVLARYFDAMLYLASWGTRRLMFRFPRALIPRQRVERYCVEDVLTFEDEGDWLVLDLRWDDEGGSDWVEGEGQLSALIPLRDDILRRDYRTLYLGWLKAVELDTLPKEEEEPPVPPGLTSPSPALRALTNVFQIDPFLLSAAAQASGSLDLRPCSNLLLLIPKLSRRECNEYLERLVQGDSHVRIELMTRLQGLDRKPGDESVPAPRARTIAELRAIAANLRTVENEKRAAAQAAKRLQELESLAAREDSLWRDVEHDIQKYKYRDAIDLLVRLQEVAIHKRRTEVFQERVRLLMARYKTRRTWLEGLRTVGLVA
jgi:hypothetical protein